jgi:hypothetical protein
VLDGIHAHEQLIVHHQGVRFLGCDQPATRSVKELDSVAPTIPLFLVAPSGTKNSLKSPPSAGFVVSGGSM